MRVLLLGAVLATLATPAVAESYSCTYNSEPTTFWASVEGDILKLGSIKFPIVVNSPAILAGVRAFAPTPMIDTFILDKTTMRFAKSQLAFFGPGDDQKSISALEGKCTLDKP